MLKKNTILLLLSFVFMTFSSVILSSQEKYYILFDNMEDQKDHEGTVISNLIDICYWDFLEVNPKYQPYLVRAPFSGSTLSKYDLTKMDVAIFILGKGKGLSHVQNGIKVLDKVKEMLDAGKRVAVIGSNVLSQDMGGSDQEAKSFWQNELGVDAFYTLDLTLERGGPPPMVDPFEIQGVEESVSGGWPKYCNGIFGRNGIEPREPVRWYESAEFHTMKQNTEVIPIDRLMVPDGINGKKVYSGVQANVGNGKIVVWTLNFDIAGVDVGHFQNGFNAAMSWFTEDIPTPESFMRYSPTTLDFKVVNENQVKTEVLTIKNYGKKPFDVTDIYLSEPELFGDAFEILDSEQLPITLKTYESVSFRLKFAPKEQKIYETTIEIETNAANVQKAVIDIRGSGGIIEDFGPELTMSNYSIDFGNVTAKSSTKLPMEFINSGTMNLFIQTMEFLENTDESFLVHTLYELPHMIAPGDKWTLVINFFPSTPDKEYKARIKISSNALNEQAGITYVYLNGITNPTYQGPQVKFSTTVLDFGVVNAAKTLTVNLENTGDRDLYFQNPKIEADAENLEVFSLSHNEIPAIPPGQSFDLDVTFNPIKEIEYFGDLVLTSNSKLYANQRIPLGGQGDDLLSVDDNGYAAISGVFEMRLNPNPVNDNTQLEFSLIGNSSRNLELVVYDMTGKRVADIHNGNTLPGTFYKSISSLDLNSGTYVINATIDNHNTAIKFIVNK